MYPSLEADTLERQAEARTVSASAHTQWTALGSVMPWNRQCRVQGSGTISELMTLYYTNLYPIYHRNVPVSRTFEIIRIVNRDIRS